MVFFDIKDGVADKLRSHLLQKGIIIGPGQNKIRLVTHLGYGSEDIDFFIDELQNFFG